MRVHVFYDGYFVSFVFSQLGKEILKRSPCSMGFNNIYEWLFILLRSTRMISRFPFSQFFSFLVRFFEVARLSHTDRDWPVNFASEFRGELKNILSPESQLKTCPRFPAFTARRRAEVSGIRASIRYLVGRSGPKECGRPFSRFK